MKTIEIFLCLCFAAVLVLVVEWATNIPEVHQIDNQVVKVVDKGQEVPEEDWPEILSGRYHTVHVGPAWMRVAY